MPLTKNKRLSIMWKLGRDFRRHIVSLPPWQAERIRTRTATRLILPPRESVNTPRAGDILEVRRFGDSPAAPFHQRVGEFVIEGAQKVWLEIDGFRIPDHSAFRSETDLARFASNLGFGEWGALVDWWKLISELPFKGNLYKWQ